MSDSDTIRLIETDGSEPGHSRLDAYQPAGLSPAEGLRLFKALTSIQDAALRKNVIHLVELLAATGQKR
jgi:hypothetical protein